jgi:Protein of unknown function (DUF4197)
MNRHCLLSVLLLLLLVIVPVPSRAGYLDDMMKSLGSADTPGAGLDNGTIVKGLKEALTTGTGRAVAAVSRQDGYFGNQAIKILVPEKLRSTADLLRQFGYRQEVDDFVLGMNRAAEKAAPKATEYFMSALKAMSFDDARKILQGGNTSATEYFRQKTGADIHRAFKPVVSSSLQEVGAVKSYRQMMEKFYSIPFAGSVVTFDLDDYVVTKAVDGLFTMLGEEEAKIRTDPAARGTELLRKVFGN